MKSIAVIACGCGLVCAMSACGGDALPKLPLTQQEATESANKNVAQQLDRAAEVVGSLEDSSVPELLSGLFPDQVDCSTSSEDPVPGSEPAPEPVDPQDGEDLNLGEAIKELVGWLEANVFHGDFAESTDDKTVVYRMDPQVVCSADESLDQACVDLLDKVPLRLSASSPREGDLDVRVLVGADKRLLGTLRLYGQEVVLRAELEHVNWLLQQLAAQDEEPAAFPEVAQGVVELRLSAGDDGVRVSFAVIEALRLAFEQGELAGLDLRVARAEPALVVKLTQDGKRVELSAGWGAIDLALPGALICESEEQSGGDGGPGDAGASEEEGPTCGTQEQEGSFSVHLGGLSGTIVVDDDTSQVRFDDLSLGSTSTTLALNGTPLTTLDLNPAADRRFSALISEVAGGIEVTVEPALNLKVAMALMHLSETVRTDLPEWLAEEIFEVMLGGAPKTKLLIPTDDDPCDDQPAGQVKVVEGSLTLAAKSLDSDVVVPAGQCISSAELDDAHPFETIQPSACP